MYISRNVVTILTMSSFRIVVIARSVFATKQSPRKPGDCFALLAVTKCVEFIEQEFNLTLSNYSGCHCEGVFCPKQSPGNWEIAYLRLARRLLRRLLPPRNDIAIWSSIHEKTAAMSCKPFFGETICHLSGEIDRAVTFSGRKIRE